MFLSSQWPPILHTSSPLQCSDESLQYGVRLMYRHCLHHCFVFVLGSFSQKFSFVIYGTIGIALYFYEVMEEVLLSVVYHKFVIGVLVYHEQTPG